MITGSEYREVHPDSWRTVWKFVCDGCGKVYEKEEKKDRREKPTHYHSLQCANRAQVSGGALDIVRREIFNRNLGVDYPQQSKVVQRRSKETCLKKYDVSNVQQVPEIKQRSCDTFLSRLEKRQGAGGYWTSKDEDRFYLALLEYFTIDDVIRQKRTPPSRRPIDFYIKSIDTYV